MSYKTYVAFCALIVVSLATVHGQEVSPLESRSAVAPRRLPALNQVDSPGVTSLDRNYELATATAGPSLFTVSGQMQTMQPIGLVSHNVAVAGSCSGACAPPCDQCCNTCCDPVWAHRSGVFGEYLHLRARNADIAYAVPVDGGIGPPLLPPPTQRGAVGVTDPGYDSGYRVGGTYAFDCESSMTLSYTRFESNTVDNISTTAGLALRAIVLHPSSANAASDFLDATANLGIDYHLVDADYRAAWFHNDCSVINYNIGVRYAQIEQNFEGVFTNAGTTELLSTGVDFEGVGLRLGLDGERHLGHHGLFVYGQAMANFIAGESSGTYVQSTSPAAPEVDTSWSAGRLVTILELKLGGGWQSRCGHYRLSAGYQFNSWQDLVTADQFIQGVQNNNYVDMSDSLTFDGLNATFEYRW